MKSLRNFMVIIKYRKIILNDSLFILLSQFVAVPESFLSKFCKEKNLWNFTQSLKSHAKYKEIKYLSQRR